MDTVRECAIARPDIIALNLSRNFFLTLLLSSYLDFFLLLSHHSFPRKKWDTTVSMTKGRIFWSNSYKQEFLRGQWCIWVIVLLFGVVEMSALDLKFWLVQWWRTRKCQNCSTSMGRKFGKKCQELFRTSINKKNWWFSGDSTYFFTLKKCFFQAIYYVRDDLKSKGQGYGFWLSISCGCYTKVVKQLLFDQKWQPWRSLKATCCLLGLHAAVRSGAGWELSR